MNFKHIYEGWKNHFFPSSELKEQIEKVSSERLSICRDCSHNSEVARRLGQPFPSSWRTDEHCIQCGCTLIAKTKCLHCECPIGKWFSLLTEEESKHLNDNSSL